jgi:hypothetical protein
MECSICLDDIKDNHTCKILSCGHQFHFKCYMNCVFNHGTIFIKCPLCREINTCNKKPHNDPFLNLKELCVSGRCTHKTKAGKRCKKNSFVLNYGCCKIHQRDYLVKDKYKLMSDYIYSILMTGNKKKTKIIMIDIAKKLVMKYSDIKDVSDIHYYFHKYYNLNMKASVIQWEDFYDYYELESIDEGWLNKCITKNILY